MPKSPDAFRTISEVADWLGIQAHVLRFWESKFSQVKPIKRAGGRRYYRPADMLLLGGIKKLLHDDGLTIKGVQKILREDGIAQVSALSTPLDELTMSELGDATQAAAPPLPVQVADADVEETGVVMSFEPPAEKVEKTATETASEAPAKQEATAQEEVAPAAEAGPLQDAGEPDVAEQAEAAAPHVAEPAEATPAQTPEEVAPEDVATESVAPQDAVTDPEAPDPAMDTAEPATVETHDPVAAEPESSEPVPVATAQDTAVDGSTMPAPDTPDTDPAEAATPETTTPEPAAPADLFDHAAEAPAQQPGEGPISDPEPAPQEALHGSEPADPPAPDAPPPAAEVNLPAFLRRPAETAPQPSDVAAEEPTPEPAPAAPAPKPRRIDIPAFTSEADFDAAPATLTLAYTTQKLNTAQAAKIQPLLEKLTVLRDSMAARRRGGLGPSAKD